MSCPVCSGPHVSDHVSLIDKRGRRVVVQGEVHAIVGPDGAHYPPFSDYYTVSVYPRKGRVKYLEFSTQQHRDRWGFVPEQRIRCEGCMHETDGKEMAIIP